jgi:hypothetical protein
MCTLPKKKEECCEIIPKIIVTTYTVPFMGSEVVEWSKGGCGLHGVKQNNVS